MENNESSAERELLKAIENSDDNQNSGSIDSSARSGRGTGEGTETADTESVGKPSILANLKNNLSFGGYALSLYDTKKILSWLIMFLFLWLFLVAGKGVYDLGNLPEFHVTALDVAETTGVEDEIPIEKFSHYADILLGRNIFLPVAKKETAGKGLSDTGTNDVTRKLKIAGLAWVPEEEGARHAMIEDTQTGITYYVQEGSPVANFEVKSILEDKVILTYMSEEIELQ